MVQTIETINSANAEPPRKMAAKWRTLPVQEELDRHMDSFHAEVRTPDGLTVLAARVRGRQHCHEGRNCDDWFEIGQAGEWTLIAVADGAGSQPLSRVGAKVSCRAAVAELSRQLSEVKTPSVFHAENAAPANVASFIGLEAYMRSLKAVYLAVESACIAVEQACGQRAEQHEYQKKLGRRPSVTDFAATLSLLVFKVVSVDGVRFALGWSYQIGDGLSAGIDSAGNVQLFGKRDQGEQANETLFLSRDYLGRELGHRIRKIYLPLNAVMVMTDGVIELPRYPLPVEVGAEMLYADMVLNNVVPPPVVTETEVEAALSGTRYASLNWFMNDASFHHQVEGQDIAGNGVLPFADSELLAGCLGVDLSVVTASPALLAIGARRTAVLNPATPSAKWLETWLKSFPWRGCYDDRTLVVAYGENQR